MSAPGAEARRLDVPPLLYLGAEDVRRALPMAAAIEAVREAFRDLAEGRATMPARIRMDGPREGEVSLVMPSRSQGISRLAVKLIDLFDGNREAGLPLAHALVILADGVTGVPLAVLDGGSLTVLRTGAVSGLASDLLARPKSAIAAILGAGRQGKAQLEALAAVRRLIEVRVFDPDRSAAESLARHAAEALGVEGRAMADSGEAVRGADLISAATTAREPVFADADISDGAHINAVGVYQPDRAEVPPETARRARVVVDQTAAALEEAGDLLRPLAAGLIGREAFGVELGDILLGRAAGRRSAAEITLFKSVGLAVQDLYAAARAYERAVERGLGIPLPR